MSQTVTRLVVGLLIAGAGLAVRADEPKPKADPVAIARQILDDATPAERRNALTRDHPTLAPELIVAMTVDLKPGQEEYRRIPWIWRVAIGAGRRNNTEQLRRLLDVSLPKTGEALRDWQAVVIGGGLINGISLEKKWPAERFAEILKNHDSLAKRWSAALTESHRMAEDEKVPTGTRYDALRMIALDSWDKCGERLSGYLKKGTHAELQMGAISGLSDIDRPEIAALLAGGLADFPPGNRKLAIEALLRTDARKAVLKERFDKGQIDKSWLDENQRSALQRPK